MNLPRWLQRHPQTVVGVLRDLLFLAGAGCLVTGIHRMHPPSAWIVTGALLMLPALRVAFRSRKPR